MTPEQQRKMLECAAKACGLSVKPMEIKNVTAQGDDRFIGLLADEWSRGWFDPLTNPADTAEMCARLEIDTRWHMGREAVECIHKQDAWPACRAFAKDHDNSRLKAWMHAATMVAAKTQGYEG